MNTQEHQESDVTYCRHAWVCEDGTINVRVSGCDGTCLWAGIMEVPPDAGTHSFWLWMIETDRFKDGGFRLDSSEHMELICQHEIEKDLPLEECGVKCTYCGSYLRVPIERKPEYNVYHCNECPRDVKIRPKGRRDPKTPNTRHRTT